jgi:hypothetical protein
MPKFAPHLVPCRLPLQLQRLTPGLSGREVSTFCTPIVFVRSAAGAAIEVRRSERSATSENTAATAHCPKRMRVVYANLETPRKGATSERRQACHDLTALDVEPTRAVPKTVRLSARRE